MEHEQSNDTAPETRAFPDRQAQTRTGSAASSAASSEFRRRIRPVPDDAFFRHMFDQMTAAMLTDEEGRVIYVNSDWVRKTGHTFNEVRGRRVRDFIPDTRTEDVIRTGRMVLGYQIETLDPDKLYHNCFPLYADGRIIGSAVITVSMDALKEADTYTHAISKMHSQLRYYQEEVRKLRGPKYRINDLVGSSPQMQKVRQEIRKAAESVSTVLIEGETGCGKELVADAIHDLSPRTDKNMVKINCSAIPPNLFESELFGYEAGAFTGASRHGKPGLFETAHQGSLFLDEINQMPYFMQPKLLRVLQEREIHRVGSNRVIPVDVRIIAATNQPLEALIEKEKFRKDLYYRLNVLTIHVPPLREHITDIPELAESIRLKLNYMMGTHVEGITQDVENRLMNYAWPGNIRELNNVMEKAFNLTKSGVLNWSSFDDYFVSKKTWAPGHGMSLRAAKDDTEQAIIQKTLEVNHYNKTATAKELGISRTLLYQKLAKYDIKS